MNPVQATYTVSLDNVEVGRIDKITFRDYRHSRTRTFEQLAERTGWWDSASRDVHDRRWQGVVELLVRNAQVDPEDARAVAQSPRVTVTRRRRADGQTPPPELAGDGDA